MMLRLGPWEMGFYRSPTPILDSWWIARSSLDMRHVKAHACMSIALSFVLEGCIVTVA